MAQEEPSVVIEEIPAIAEKAKVSQGRYDIKVEKAVLGTRGAIRYVTIVFLRPTGEDGGLAEQSITWSTTKKEGQYELTGYDRKSASDQGGLLCALSSLREQFTHDGLRRMGEHLGASVVVGTRGDVGAALE